MKFIRLVSNPQEDEGILDNEFNQDIQISENSQIAYRSIAIELNTEIFEVTPENNKISYQSNINDSTTLNTALLNEQTYSASNPDEILNDLQDKINESLLYNSKNIGTQFQVIKKDGKTRIESKFSPNSVKVLRANFSGNFGYTLNDSSIAANGNISSSSSQSDDRNILYSLQELGKGCSVFRTRIRNLTDNGAASNLNGFEIGLSDVNPSSWTTGASFTLSDAIKTFNVSLGKPTENYFYNDKISVNQDSGVTPKNTVIATYTKNDIIEFRKVGLNLECRIFRDLEATANLLFTCNLSTTYTASGQFKQNQPLYPYIILHGSSASCMLDGYTRCFFDPFTSNVTPLNNDVVTVEDIDQGNDHHGLSIVPSISKPQNPTKGEFKFFGIGLAVFLGFTQSIFRSETLDAFFIKHSETNFTAMQDYDNLVLELIDIQLDSYDGLSKGRRNILATIPTVKNQNNVIVNEANNLVFIDIKNTSPRNLRNIKCRILFGDLTPVNPIGLTSVTLLIKGPNE